jgi:flagellar basal body-associated protein FliL
MGLLTIVLIVVIVLVILGIGIGAFWDALVRGFNIAKDRAEGFVDEARSKESNDNNISPTTTTDLSE